MILVTGSTGFVGSKLLTALGSNIRVLSRARQSDYDTVICDFQTDKIPSVALDEVDTVFHLAGVAHDFRDTDKIRDFYQTVNINATIELAKLSVKSGVKSFVFVSSVKAGGLPPSGECVGELYHGVPEGIYGQSKREAELALLKIGKESDMHVSIIRSPLVYGPNAKGNLKLMLLGISRGWFPPLPEVGNQRSMIHVDDLVRAILFVAEDRQSNGEIFIATDGVHYSSREIYEVMCKILGKPVPRWSVPKILFDMVGLVNPRIKHKIKKLLGNECYSSSKLEKLGFRAKKSLKDMNETDF